MLYYNVQVMYTDGYSSYTQYPHSETYQKALNDFAKEVKKSEDIAYLSVTLLDTEDESVYKHAFIEGKGYERFVDNI